MSVGVSGFKNIVGWTLVLVGFGLVATLEWNWRRATREPLAVPIRLQEGYSGQWPFMASVSGPHEIVLEASYSADWEDSLLGATLREATPEDSAARTEVNLSWELWEEGHFRERGRAAGRNSGYFSLGTSPRSGRVLFRADLSAWHHYQLRAFVEKSGPTLDKMSPVVKVQRHGAYYEGIEVIRLLARPLALICGLAGGFLLWRSRRDLSLRRACKS